MIDHLSKEQPLKNRLQQILNNENLGAQHALISAIATELGVTPLTCAAALLYLTQSIENLSPPAPQAQQKTAPQLPAKNVATGIKMIRYRLDVGSKHKITLDQLKKVLIEESGVDKNNISNVNIQNLYTLIELPDEMPPDIFQHLKSVEINQHKLDIRRVKTHNKKRGNNYIRRGRKHNAKPGNEQSDSSNKTVV
jgi:hypothetical protein